MDRTYTIPPLGSLGLLALGHVGLDEWRAVRGTDWIEELERSVRSKRKEMLPSTMRIVVVSGLPRSGTSMAMQMLEAGGLPVFTDGHRTEDESNPRGYYEHDRVRKIATDRAWVPDAAGHAVKVVAPLAVHLPAGPDYRIVLMERSLDEIITSQAAMLSRTDAQATTDETLLRPAYQRFMRATTDWASKTKNVSLLRLQHRDVIQDPAGTSEVLAAFAGLPDAPLDAAAMARAVDPSLHRERSVSL